MAAVRPRSRNAFAALTRPAPADVSQEPKQAADPEVSLIQALRNGDEDAFRLLVGRLHTSLIRTAIQYVRCPEAAEDVVQETWVGFLLSVDRFEGRCSVKTWLFRILFNKAKTRAAKDQRFVPFSSLAARESASADTAVDPSCFYDDANDGRVGLWAGRSGEWHSDPERVLLDQETLEAVKQAIAQLPPAQGTVMLMRDVEGMSSREVCNALGITATNQRVLLHRARAKVRNALASRYGAES